MSDHNKAYKWSFLENFMLVQRELSVVRRIDPRSKFLDVLSNSVNPCVDVVLYRDSESKQPIDRQVLMVERNEEPAKGLFWPPGGRWLKNENLPDCARRKVREECGIENIEILRQIGAIPFSSNMCSQEGVTEGYHAVGIDYLARLIPGEHKVQIDHTSKGYNWMGFQDIERVNPQGLHPYLFDMFNRSEVFGRNFEKFNSYYGQPEIII